MIEFIVCALGGLIFAIVIISLIELYSVKHRLRVYNKIASCNADLLIKLLDKHERSGKEIQLINYRLDQSKGVVSAFDIKVRDE